MTTASIAPRGNRWAVMAEGRTRAMAIVDSLDAAIFLAKCYASIIHIFGADGRICERIAT